MSEHDVLVVGGGPAGLGAALLLGRSRRSVLLCDGGEARNAATHASHSFLTQDGTPPLELRAIARDQLAPYTSVTLSGSTVDGLARQNGHFVATLNDGRMASARKVVLATGVRDELPAVEGLAALWGTSAFACPYCDGWEWRDQPWAILANGDEAAQVALLFRQWSRDQILLTNGPATLCDEQREQLRALQIEVREEPIARLESEGGRLSHVVFADGERLARSVLFLRTTLRPRTELAVQLGCELTDEPPVPALIRVDAMGQTTVPGVYAAGDVTTRMQQVAMAVSTGAAAGAMINHELVHDDLNGQP